MKKSTFLTLSLLTAGLTLAQLPLRAADASAGAGKPAMGENSRRDQGAGQLKMLAEKLNLTDAQKAQAADILKAQGEKLAALRESAGDKREKMKEMRAIRDDCQAKIRAILTPEQQKIFDALPKRGPGGGEHRAHDGGA